MDSYLLAVTPPEDVSKKVHEYRTKYRKHTYTIAPHITIYPPFYLKNISLESLYEQLARAIRDFSRKEIHIDSIAFFNNGHDKNVCYFKPDDKSTQYLGELFSISAEVLKGITANKYEHYDLTRISYKPHLTISSNIPDEDLLVIKDELKNRRENFVFPLIFLDIYEQKGDTGSWNKIQGIPL